MIFLNMLKQPKMLDIFLLNRKWCTPWFKWTFHRCKCVFQILFAKGFVEFWLLFALVNKLIKCLLSCKYTHYISFSYQHNILRGYFVCSLSGDIWLATLEHFWKLFTDVHTMVWTHFGASLLFNGWKSLSSLCLKNS